MDAFLKEVTDFDLAGGSLRECGEKWCKGFKCNATGFRKTSTTGNVYYKLGPKKQPHLSVQNITAIKSRFISSSTDVQKLEHLRKTCLVYYNYFLKDMAKCRFFVLLKGDLHCFRSIGQSLSKNHTEALPAERGVQFLGLGAMGGGMSIA